jgi:acetyl-CoA C-acetyltransferase
MSTAHQEITMSDRIIIASAARTPMGAFQGELACLTAPQLGAAAIRAAVERAGLKPEQIEEVIMGCVLRPGPGPGPPGSTRRRPAAIGRLHHGQ